MEPDSTPRGGLLNSFRRVSRSLLALAHNRFELAAVEWQEEKIRLLALLLQVAAVVVAGTLCVLMLLALIVYALWQISPWLALCLPLAFLGLATALLTNRIWRRLKTGPQPFSETIAAFKKDMEWLSRSK